MLLASLGLLFDHYGRRIFISFLSRVLCLCFTISLWEITCSTAIFSKPYARQTTLMLSTIVGNDNDNVLLLLIFFFSRSATNV